MVRAGPSPAAQTVSEALKAMLRAADRHGHVTGDSELLQVNRRSLMPKTAKASTGAEAWRCDANHAENAKAAHLLGRSRPACAAPSGAPGRRP